MPSPMKRTLSDFSQLSKGMFKTQPSVAEEKGVSPVSAAETKPRSTLTPEEQAVIDFFARPSSSARNAGKRPVSPFGAGSAAVARPVAAEADTAALCAKLRESEERRSASAADAAALADDLARVRSELAAAEKRIASLTGEVGRLKGELAKAAQTPAGGVVAESGTSCENVLPAPQEGLLAAPAAFPEAFHGEVREMLLSALSDVRDAARQSTRERRAAVLDAVLAVNRPTGELDRRRAELKQILKDAGYYTDPHALEELGFKLVSGRTHWKLDYAGVRMPIAKTPSDCRANLNAATDMANRCF